MQKRVNARSFEDLVVWQRAHGFVLKVYQLAESFPRHEIFGLSSQFRRAAVSIAANLAEGFKKRSKLDKARVFNIAQGSAEECRYYLILSRDLGYADTVPLQIELDEVARLLDSYRTTILESSE